MKNQRSFDEATAKAVLDSAQRRAAKLNQSRTVLVHAFALRPETFIAVLKASPGLVRWEKIRGQLEYAPMYNVNGDDWRVIITDVSMESQTFRAKVIGFQGSYLADPMPIEGAAA